MIICDGSAVILMAATVGKSVAAHTEHSMMARSSAMDRCWRAQGNLAPGRGISRNCEGQLSDYAAVRSRSIIAFPTDSAVDASSAASPAAYDFDSGDTLPFDTVFEVVEPAS